MRGSWRAPGRAAEEAEVETLSALPKPPGFLGDVAKAEWYRVGPDLIADELLAERDLAAFTSYCLAVGLVASCEMALNAYALANPALGMMLLGPQGMKVHPLIATARQARSEIRQFAGEFGLSPAARTKVKSPTQKPGAAEANPFAATASG